jgi:hypothetical protein
MPPDAPDGARATLEDPLAEAVRLVDLADARGLLVRMMGGLAFQARVPTWRAPAPRPRRDIDLATNRANRSGLVDLLTAEGYVADRHYNALYGHKQLYFVDPARDRPVDVLVDRLEMCHRFEFGDRLGVTARTLPLAELLLSKLQIVKINRKDVLDVLVLLGEYPLAEEDRSGDEDAISVRRVVEHTSSDWGWWRTTTTNLAGIDETWRHQLSGDELDVGRPSRFDPIEQARSLLATVQAAPKSTRWKLRARIGDRVAWYDEPEEIAHGRD